MPRKRHTAEQIIGLLRHGEVELAQGRTVGEICRGLGVSEASFYRWRSEYGSLKLDQARRLKGWGHCPERAGECAAEAGGGGTDARPADPERSGAPRLTGRDTSRP
jgi:hypothetical protein